MGVEFAAKRMETLPCTRIVSSRYHVESCSFSPDGNLLAVCFGDYSVRVLRIAERKRENSSDHAHPSSILIELEWMIKEHKESVWCARFSPDGRFLCTCSSDKTAKIWDLKSRSLARNFDAHLDTVWCCCYTLAPAFTSAPKCHVVATGSSDKTVKIWSTEGGEVLLDLDEYGDAVDSLEFSSNCALLCTSCRDGVVKIWTNLLISERLKLSSSNNSTSNFCKPVCLALTYVNRSASRFCMFSNAFPSACPTQPHSTPATTQVDTENTHCPANESSPSNIDPNELLFAGGPNNWISVWSVGDVQREFMQPSERQEESSQFDKENASSDKEHTAVSLSMEEEEKVGSVSKDVTRTKNEGVADDHVIQSNELPPSNKGGDAGALTALQSVDKVVEDTVVLNIGAEKVERLRTELELETIMEEQTSEVARESTTITVNVADGPVHVEDSHSLRSSASLQTSFATPTEIVTDSYLNDEQLSFYRVGPRWTLTDHVNTVWDCCTAVFDCPEPEQNTASTKDVCNDKHIILVSCSGDRTLR